MTEMQCRELVGAYAVGALEPPEAARLADHLLTCTRCRHELDEAEDTAALMAAVPPEAFMDEPADPNDPLLMRTLYAIRLEASEQAAPPRVAAAPQLQAVRGEGGARPAGSQSASGGFPGWSGQTARSHRRRPRATSASQQRRQLAFAGAAAAAVLVLGGGVLIGSKMAGSDDPTTRTAPVAQQTSDTTAAPPTNQVAPAQFGLEGADPTTGATLKVNVTANDNGYLTLDLDGSSLPAGQDVEVVASSAVNEEVVVGTMKVAASGVLDETKLVKMAPSDLATVSVRTSSAEILVTAKRP
jgi:hypothetical protein